MLCVHISKDGEVNLRESGSRLPKSLAGPEQLDLALFAPAAELSPETIRKSLFAGRNGRYQSTGRKLFDAVMKGEVLRKWQELRRDWEMLPAPLPFRTCFCVENAVLAEIPWELMYSPQLSLFQSETAPGMRCLTPQPDPQPAAQLRIRVMVINGADPSDGAIKAAEEVAAIEAALSADEHAFDLESIHTAARGAAFGIRELQTEIASFAPHILHFIGHSETAPPGGSAALPLHNRAGYVRWYTPQIAPFLDGLDGLRLTYLNACRTALPSPLEQAEQLQPALTYSLAETFLRRSLAVIALQHDVRGLEAEICAREFYTRLANGAHVDAAICHARLVLSGEFSPESSAAYLPALVVKTMPEDVLRLRSAEIAHVDPDIKKISDRFVNHRPLRRDVYDRLFGRPPLQRRAILVTGNDGNGKTWLIKWTLYSLLMRGVRVHYIDKPAGNWLDILRQIRDSNANSCMLSQGCCTEEQADEFNWTLEHFARGLTAPPFKKQKPAVDDRPLPAILQGDPKPINNLQERLCTSLISILDSGPETVLAIDHWTPGTRETEETPQILNNYFFAPLARRRNSPVRLILSVSGEPREGDFPNFEPESVGVFGAPELPDLAVQLLRKIYGSKVTDTAVKFVRDNAPPNMSARDLHESLNAMRLWLR